MVKRKLSTPINHVGLSEEQVFSGPVSGESEADSGAPAYFEDFDPSEWAHADVPEAPMGQANLAAIRAGLESVRAQRAPDNHEVLAAEIRRKTIEQFHLSE